MSENRIDRLTRELAISTAHRLSRRNLLTSFGKLIIAGLGATILDALPVDRRVQAHSDQNCSDWRWCNMNGYPCKCRGGSNTTCPGSGCNYGGSPWTGCCLSTDDGCYYNVIYYDCCGSCQAASPTCDCGSSDPNANRNWCYNQPATAYKCTLAVVTARCGGCLPPIPPK